MKIDQPLLAGHLHIKNYYVWFCDFQEMVYQNNHNREKSFGSSELTCHDLEISGRPHNSCLLSDGMLLNLLKENIKLNVKLMKVVRDNFDYVIELELEEAQKKHLPSNVFSLAESTLSPLFHPRAICMDNKVVGFLMYEFGEIGNFDEDQCTIWRFMIDRKHQNTGIGKIAMGLVLKEIKGHERCKLVDIYYDPKNLAAKKLYTRYSFKEVGYRDDGDVIAEVRL